MRIVDPGPTSNSRKVSSFKLCTYEIICVYNGFIAKKDDLRLKDVNAYLKENLRMKEKKPAKKKEHVVEVWKRIFRS